MNVLVLNGSPKEKSDTFRMTDAFLKGLNREGAHDVRVIRVIEKDIAPCRGCFACWQRGDGHCVTQDDQNAILDLFRAADAIIWSFPLYAYAMPSHLKAVLDRTVPLSTVKMVRRPDGSIHHETLVDFSQKRTLVICGCGFPNWEGNFDGLRAMCRACFRGADMVCVPEAPLLNIPEAAPVAEPLLARFERAGEEYAAALTLCAQTVAELETPMIPAEEYLRRVNAG